jgi:DNA-binding CsgD family transcriptional regulator
MTRQRQFALIAAALFALLVLSETLRSDGPFDPVALAADLLEFALLAGAVAMVAFVAVDMHEMRRDQQRLLRDLDTARAEGARWRRAARSHVEGLSRAIRTQFEIWHLTDAEADVAILMLKGLSHKEIATIRAGSEATVRQHAASVYRKSGLANRAQFTGYFLEDLLAPAKERGHASVDTA